MILPKKIFSSLTDWTKANYTSWGWTGSEKGPITLSHETGTCEVTAINNLEVECKPTSGRFGDYFQLADAQTSSMAVCIEFIFDTPEHAKALADYKKIFFFDATQVYNDDLIVQRDTHVFVFGNLSGDVTWRLVDMNGSAPTDYTILKKVRIRIFDPYIVLKSHLKPISVGDKLGLVYWDGTTCANSSCSIGISGLNEANFLIGSYNPDKFGYGLQLFKHQSGNDRVYKKLRVGSGTVNLSGYGITATSLESTGSGEKLKDHLFHVI